jgi:hypothetical protein
VIVPIAAYLALRAMLHSDAYALAVTETVPVAWILVDGRRRRRLNPLILTVAAVLAVALILTVASSGSALPLKLRRAVITGSLGVAGLASLLHRRPLLPALLETLGRSGPQRITGLARSLRQRLPEHTAVGLTAIAGLTLIPDAVAQAVLALTVSTTVFVAIAGLVRLAPAIVGLGICAVYLRSARAAPARSG